MKKIWWNKVLQNVFKKCIQIWHFHRRIHQKKVQKLLGKLNIVWACRALQDANAKTGEWLEIDRKWHENNAYSPKIGFKIIFLLTFIFFAKPNKGFSPTCFIFSLPSTSFKHNINLMRNNLVTPFILKG